MNTLQASAATSDNSYVATFNIMCSLVIVVAFAFYLITANSLASHAWKAAQTQGQLSQGLNARNALIDQQAALEDRNRLESLALASGMIVDSGSVYLVEATSVAAR
ncbi:MAG: hypothetical protein KBC02_02820 [Candidatus Pacebacteria bacterium]|nr:hypothetical protein [Candidatus Paceibacterota bacterium]